MTDKEKIIELLQTRMEKLQNSDSRDDSIAYYEVGHIIDLIKALPEEPVSEDLSEAAYKELDRVSQQYPIIEGMIEIFKAGAQWQKQQFEKNRLEHCDSITEEQYNLEVGFIDGHIDKYNRMPTFLDAIEYGMEKMKEEMMAKAIDATVHIEAGNYPYIPQLELYDYDKDKPLAKEGDKYKVVLIKED